MNRLAPLVVGVIGLSVLSMTPAGAAALRPDTAEPAVSCGASGLQAGLATRICVEVTGTTAAVYGTVALAGPPSPGSPAPRPKELLTTLTAEIVGGAAPSVQTRPVIFNSSTLTVNGPAVTAPCGSTVRGTFGVASYPWAPNPVVHDVVIAC
ncbi:hypothetical protein [Streptomyces sp. NPDC090022]|uniref:hypothetical protein n=1 Tax=Streptomyces sp. NPDC090022 TaxID=3365920 RepID=UPI003800A66B